MGDNPRTIARRQANFLRRRLRKQGWQVISVPGHRSISCYLKCKQPTNLVQGVDGEQYRGFQFYYIRISDHPPNPHTKATHFIYNWADVATFLQQMGDPLPIKQVDTI
jgi:hypothetical protein